MMVMVGQRQHPHMPMMMPLMLCANKEHATSLQLVG
jgi:hypothetical protein